MSAQDDLYARNGQLDQAEKRIAQLEAEVAALREALQHEKWCVTCGEAGCDSCCDCTTVAALSRSAGADFEARIRADERALCARAVEASKVRRVGALTGAGSDDGFATLQDAAAAIRARGGK